MIENLKRITNRAKEKIIIHKLFSNVSLSPGLNLSQMGITRIRAIYGESLLDIFDKIYESYGGAIRPRLTDKGIILNASFSYCKKDSTGITSSAPLAYIVDPHHLTKNRTPNVNEPHYVRFNTEFCMDIPPARNYTELDDLIDPYITSVDPDFVEKKAPLIKERVVMLEAMQKKRELEKKR